MSTESEHRSKEEKATARDNKKFKFSRTEKILLSAVDLSIYISETSNTVSAKERYEMHAEEPPHRWCWEEVSSPRSLQLRNSVTTTVPNLGLRKCWIADSLLINEGGFRVLYPRRQIALLSKMRTTINLSFKASGFGFRSRCRAIRGL